MFFTKINRSGNIELATEIWRGIMEKKCIEIAEKLTKFILERNINIKDIDTGEIIENIKNSTKK